MVKRFKLRSRPLAEFGHDRRIVRIGLAQTVAKYPGETEKHPVAPFDEAEAKSCVLAVDEAGPLFGHRIEITDSRNRDADQAGS